MNTGEIGVVLKEHRSSRLQPELAVILDSGKQRKQSLEIIDLKDQRTPTVWIEHGIEPGAYNIDPKEYFL